MGVRMFHMRNASVSGRKFFHSRCMSWSERNRGYVARVHKNREVRRSVLVVKHVVNNSGEWVG